jgi:hypothetical protein
MLLKKSAEKNKLYDLLNYIISQRLDPGNYFYSYFVSLI